MTTTTDENVPKGAFMTSLQRNNKEIRKDRALTIAEETELVYKRKVEDLDTAIKRLQRKRDAMLDLSPTDAKSLVLAKDFDAAKFVEDDLAIGVEIRNLSIQLEIARQSYTYLFTQPIEGGTN